MGQVLAPRIKQSIRYPKIPKIKSTLGLHNGSFAGATSYPYLPPPSSNAMLLSVSLSLVGSTQNLIFFFFEFSEKLELQSRFPSQNVNSFSKCINYECNSFFLVCICKFVELYPCWKNPFQCL